MTKIRRTLKNKIIQGSLEQAFDNAWLQIINRKATIIQAFARGYIFRKQHQSDVEKIKEAGRQCRIRGITNKIQKNARGFLARQKLKKMNRSAYYIQGFFRMKGLNSVFNLMRSKVVVVQHQVRAFLARRRAMKVKYEKYVLPMERRVNLQKQKEEHDLFGVGERTDLDQSTLSESEHSQMISPFLYRSYSPKREHSVVLETAENFDLDGENVQFDEILGEDDDEQVNKKMRLFGFIVDLEVLLDTSEYFTPSFAKNYKKLFEHTFSNDNYLQTLHVGGTHAFATSSQGKVYAWGMNDFHQLGLNRQSLKPLKPTILQSLQHARIQNIATGTDHTLILCTDG